ncbi:RNA polymerase sigma-70 factor [Mucilaginibacter lappiensis]|uniref:RNA polymerase sigma-70 factor (ECF subfamily) n=1 Tax=Mucilaginibacter lappiensis TaxID=354630 RepID=A0A1N6NN28_9SPHI|nr:RNA polymerase sigma-70 factor [Mucilaginibacter lappiensis]MBB6107894.1 RNA polymerase sigma-70 factor (ECF subfamily) [Mucilaginibacter lappiensis]MBB6126036.1 RNA polymerase sigma-70 factor (ECF subfamily) [Mucilaginibacter lappiensis]SIP93484.1 RNA polymerase sigma-70 factor, ECF subfamily [Mucilaginibacter lappiensis]
MSDYNNYTDELLTFHLKKGEQAAFTEIYNRYWKQMLAIAWNHCKDSAVAKDIVHDVFISLWEKCNLSDIRNLPAFLAGAIKLSIYHYYQKEQRRSELAQQHLDFETMAYTEDKLDARFLQQYIDSIVEELPEKCRLVFRYSRENGMKNSEIATEMQITEKGVEANLTRALKIIRGGLKKYGGLILISFQLYRSFF